MKEPVTMTTACRDCGHVFGRFRPRCPACGTPAPKCKHGMTEGLCAVCTGTVRAVEQSKPKGRRGKQERERREDECILCRRRVHGRNAAVCKHCDEPIHKNCIGLHDDACRKFQQERNDAISNLNKANALENPAATAKLITDLVTERLCFEQRRKQ